MNVELLHVSLKKGDEPLVSGHQNNDYAAVSIIIVEESIVIEKRASSSIDPWSGQYCLPGGKYELEDSTLKKTAMRETLEETGIDLGDQEYFGFFGPYSPLNRPNMRVYSYVFRLDHKPDFKKSDEIDSIFLVQLGKFNSKGKEFVFDDVRIWGLTARILSKFCEILGL
ncbi:MAG: CoA pyrophosphatase [Thermoplasmatales archaeon]